MAQPKEALKTALDAARQLPLELQRRLAERLFQATEKEPNTVTLRLQRLPEGKSQRLGFLMDKNNEGVLGRAEKSELAKLGLEADELMLANSAALARALRPEVFDEHGRPISRRIDTLVKQSSGHRQVKPGKTKG